MADQVQWRGGSRENSDNFTGAPREVTVDTTDHILRVHDGIRPGGHKMMKVNDCLVVETADKCDPNAEVCKVTVNGDFEVHGDTELDDTVIRGNLVVDGAFLQNGTTIAVKTDEVVLTNPGTINRMGDPNRTTATGCKIIPTSGNIKSQEDANQYINECLLALEEKTCDWHTLTLNEIIDIKDDIEKLWIAVASLEGRTDALEAKVKAVEASISQILITIATIEDEVEANQDSIKEHEGRVAALEVQTQLLAQDLADLSAAAFSGDYDDLVNKPEINDGSMILQSESGVAYGSFSANEASDITIAIPDPFSGDWDDIDNKPTSFPTTSHEHTVDDFNDFAIAGESDGQVLLYDGAQKLWINADVPDSGLPEDDIKDLVSEQKLDDHVDVTVPNPKQYDVLAWDSRLQVWLAKSPLQPPAAIQVKGVINVGQPAPQNPQAGDLWFHHDPNVNTGPDDKTNAGPTWIGIVGEQITEGEYLIFSTDNEWHHTGNNTINLEELQANWTQLDPAEPDYIHNKPDIEGIVDSQAGNGEINVNAGDGLIASGNNATANQKGNTTRTLSLNVGSGIGIGADGSVVIDPTFDLNGNITPPGDGQINVNAGPGLEASGSNATANQTGNTTRTLSLKVGSGINLDADGNIIVDPNFDLSGNVTAPNDGVLTIKDSAGADLATFSANQAGPSSVTLPKGFSGNYNDLSGAPSLATVATSGSYNDLSGSPTLAAVATSGSYSDLSSTPTLATVATSGSYSDLSNKPAAPGNGTITISQPGITDQTFSVNQTGDTKITLSGGSTGGNPGNGALTIKTAGHGADGTGTFTADQSGNSTITLPTIRYGDLSGTPSLATVATSGSYSDLSNKPSIPAAAGNGEIKVDAGTGLTASGTNGTANQSGTTTRTLSLDKTYTDGLYIKKTGDTMTGSLSATGYSLAQLPSL